MNIITENLHVHCMGPVGCERATLCRFIRCILVDINGETEKKPRTLKKMQIVLNAQERHGKHIPAGTLMSQDKIWKVLNSTIYHMIFVQYPQKKPTVIKYHLEPLVFVQILFYLVNLKVSLL